MTRLAAARPALRRRAFGRWSSRMAIGDDMSVENSMLHESAPDGSAEEGSALVEAVVVIAVLLLPLLWFATALIRVEAGSYAVRMAAREAARTYVTAPSSGQGMARADVASRIAFEDQKAPIGSVAVTCTRQPCLTPGGEVRARATTTLGLPFVPSWLSGATGLRVTLSSEHAEKVEQYGGRR